MDVTTASSVPAVRCGCAGRGILNASRVAYEASRRVPAGSADTGKDVWVERIRPQMEAIAVQTMKAAYARLDRVQVRVPPCVHPLNWPGLALCPPSPQHHLVACMTERFRVARD